MTEGWPIPLGTALRRGQQLVTEVPASLPERRAWIAIYPIRHSAPTSDRQAFNVFHREFEAAYIDNGWCVGPGDGMIDLRTAQPRDENELNELLTVWGVDPAQLTYVHRTDYPA